MSHLPHPQAPSPWRTALVWATLLLVVAAALVAVAHFESRAFNRLTGASTTTWDALWLDLRVQDEPGHFGSCTYDVPQEDAR